jgi:hypothetical protein
MINLDEIKISSNNYVKESFITDQKHDKQITGTILTKTALKEDYSIKIENDSGDLNGTHDFYVSLDGLGNSILPNYRGDDFHYIIKGDVIMETTDGTNNYLTVWEIYYVITNGTTSEIKNQKHKNELETSTNDTVTLNLESDANNGNIRVYLDYAKDGSSSNTTITSYGNLEVISI